MSYEVTSKDIKTEVYPIAWSSRGKEIHLDEIFDWFFLENREFSQRPYFYRSKLPFFQIDVSSIYPHIEFRTETFSLKEAMPEEMVEYDVVVRMLPVRKYTVSLEIKSVRRAVPKIVEPKGY